MYTNKNLTCADCGQEFVFTASEQDFYAQRGFTEPRRCASCRASRKAARNAEGGGGSSEAIMPFATFRFIEDIGVGGVAPGRQAGGDDT